MKTYDYRTQEAALSYCVAKVDTFSPRQIRKVVEAVEEIALDGERESQRYWEHWFEIAVEPVLREYAEMSLGLLEINKDDLGIITVELRQERGFTITESCMLRAILIMAHNISMDAVDGEMVLTMSFDCKRYL